MSDVFEIEISEISKRFLYRYYPFWLLFAVNSAIFQKVTKASPIMEAFFSYHMHIFVIYIFVIVPLFIFKPVGRFVRLFVAIISMLAAAMTFTVFNAFDKGYAPVPFSNSPTTTLMFFSCITSGIYIVWFFSWKRDSTFQRKGYVLKRRNEFSMKKRWWRAG